ncbi:MAG: DUF4260 domain-containing protein [Bacteroidetes bacterium]|nr:DUF4260 domain-containing protein [Bacteroidota bacterium]
MKNIIRLEELGMFVLGIYLFSQLNFSWWWFPALLLAPDVSAVGYLAGNKTGAICYNFFHHKGVAIVVYLAGVYFRSEALQLAGVILFAHSSMDRLFGYGLKYFEGFKSTHLGSIGNEVG